MSKEISRKVFGIGQRGEVVLISIEDNVVDGDVKHSKRYQVRMGAFTMLETVSKADAERSAKALVA